MELGVTGLNAKGAIGPDETRTLARRAEELGYTSWWAADHVVLPKPAPANAPMDPLDPLVDPLVHLAFVAAVTDRMTIGTGIMILPQRNPVVLAKQVASLDVLSGGRFVLGVGVGYLEPEMTAVGVPMADRGRRSDEYIDAMTALWTEENPSYHGNYVSFENVDAYPRPSNPRVVVGGTSPAALRRAVARGHGWFGLGTADDLVVAKKALATAATEVDRPARLGELEISFVPLDEPGVTPDAARRYADLGVDRLVLFPFSVRKPGDVGDFLDRNADLPR